MTGLQRVGAIRLGLLALTATGLGCGDEQGPRTPAEIVVTPNQPRVPMGGTRQLNAAVVDADGRAIEDEPVTFESAEPEVVTVGDDGLLTSVGTLDTVTIAVTSGDLAAEVDAVVVPPPSSLVVLPRSLRLASGESFLLYIIVTDEHGDSIPEVQRVLGTDNAAVASVTASGYVLAGSSGLATVSVTSGEHRVEIPVTVVP